MSNQTQPTQSQDSREPIASERLQISYQNKEFFLDLFENRRGRVVRVKERIMTTRRSDMIMIPMEACREIGELLMRLADWSEKNK